MNKEITFEGIEFFIEEIKHFMESKKSNLGG